MIAGFKMPDSSNGRLDSQAHCGGLFFNRGNPRGNAPCRNRLQRDIERDVVPVRREGISNRNRDRVSPCLKIIAEWCKIEVADLIASAGAHLDGAGRNHAAIQIELQWIVDSAVIIGACRSQKQLAQFGICYIERAPEIIIWLPLRQGRDDIRRRPGSELRMCLRPVPVIE